MSVTTYVTSNLLKGEDLVYMGRISLWPYIPWMLTCLGLVSYGVAMLSGFLVEYLNPGLMILLASLIYAYIQLRYSSTELAVTTKRLILKTGIIWRSTSELYLTRIEGVEVEQSILGRMLGYGTIYVRGVGTEIAPVTNISHPILFRKAFFEAADVMLERSNDNGGY